MSYQVIRLYILNIVIISEIATGHPAVVSEAENCDPDDMSDNEHKREYTEHVADSVPFFIMLRFHDCVANEDKDVNHS